MQFWWKKNISKTDEEKRFLQEKTGFGVHSTQMLLKIYTNFHSIKRLESL